MGCSRVVVSQLALSRRLLDEHSLVQSSAVLLVMIYFLERS